ncbi:MAG: 2'-5' RNA ligase family protein [Chloroflexota bacterium]
MIKYTEDISKWEDWQQDYRLGLILIMPPPEVSQPIDALRARYDPRSFAYCPTHISVSDLLRLEMTDEMEQEIRCILKGIKPFMLHYHKPQASTERAGIAYPIRPQEPIDDLKQSLHKAAVFDGKVYGRRHIPAHMTIAEFISIEDSLSICAQLQNSVPSGSFLCDRLEYIVPNEDFHFQRKNTFSLGEDE